MGREPERRGVRLVPFGVGPMRWSVWTSAARSRVSLRANFSPARWDRPDCPIRAARCAPTPWPSQPAGAGGCGWLRHLRPRGPCRRRISKRAPGRQEWLGWTLRLPCRAAASPSKRSAAGPGSASTVSGQGCHQRLCVKPEPEQESRASRGRSSSQGSAPPGDSRPGQGGEEGWRHRTRPPKGRLRALGLGR